MSWEGQFWIERWIAEGERPLLDLVVRLKEPWCRGRGGKLEYTEENACLSKISSCPGAYKGQWNEVGCGPVRAPKILKHRVEVQKRIGTETGKMETKNTMMDSLERIV
jgi:hypothetical protein